MDTLKTTVYLNAGDYRRLKLLARARGRTTADLVREAVARYAAEEGPRARPRSIASGGSRTGDIAARAEDLLAGLGGDR